MNIRENILKEIEERKDEAYGQFQAKLIPTIKTDSVI